MERALGLCDRMVIAIGYNPAKGGAESVAGRMAAIERVYASEPRVTVTSYTGLTVDLCREVGATWMLRGVRSVADFEYERSLADINRNLAGVETLLLFTQPELSYISSSMVRELAAQGHDISKYLP